MTPKNDINSLFMACRHQLARVVSRLVPPHEVEDIVQETYVRACQYRSGGNIGSPGALMTRIARNLAIDHLKRAENRYSTPLDENVAIEMELIERHADEPFSVVASREEFGLFCEAVRNLPLQCRKVFVLKRVYGHSQRDIARALNISENTVEKHVAEGLKRCVMYMRQSEGKISSGLTSPKEVAEQ